VSSEQRTRVVIYAATSTANRRTARDSVERQLAACRAAAEAAGYEIVGSFTDEAVSASRRGRGLTDALHLAQRTADEHGAAAVVSCGSDRIARRVARGPRRRDAGGEEGATT
jgi:DNA invertase Pin-like site-specific DNA recombinase